MKRHAMVLSAVLTILMAADLRAQAPSVPPMKVRKIAVGGEGGWDYLSTDAAAKRLYVSRGNRITVVDTDAEKVVGELTDTPGVHGVAVVPELGRGFTSNGQDDTVTVFDLKTLKPTGKIKVGGRPDAIMFDPASNHVFTYNHGSKDATAIDPSAMSVAGTVALDGVPEAAVADGMGHVFVNIMDKAEVVEFDARNFKVLNRWSLAPGCARPDWRSTASTAGCSASAAAARRWSCSMPTPARSSPRCRSAAARTAVSSTPTGGWPSAPTAATGP